MTYIFFSITLKSLDPWRRRRRRRRKKKKNKGKRKSGTEEQRQRWHMCFGVIANCSFSTTHVDGATAEFAIRSTKRFQIYNKIRTLVCITFKFWKIIEPAISKLSKLNFPESSFAVAVDETLMWWASDENLIRT